MKIPFRLPFGRKAGAEQSGAAAVPLFTKLNYIFDGRQKRQFLILGIMILIGGLFETVGVSMLMPIVQTILDPGDVIKKIDS